MTRATYPKTERRPLSWKPRQRGHIYCAPACGRDCTYAEFTHATKEAEKLARILNRGTIGKDWKPVVHENMGWYWRAVDGSGRMKVHGNHYDKNYSYTAFLGESDSSGGRWAAHGRTPQAALLAVIALATEELKKVEALLEGFRR